MMKTVKAIWKMEKRLKKKGKWIVNSVINSKIITQISLQTKKKT
jgi:hypothetical protein